MTRGPAIIGSSAVAALLAALVLVGTYGTAWPHDAPSGWSYPSGCCSGYDCREVGTPHHPAGTEGIVVSERPEGYVINSTHEVIAYGDARLKDSPDGAFHWCSQGGSVVGRTICLFVPPRSY